MTSVNSPEARLMGSAIAMLRVCATDEIDRTTDCGPEPAIGIFVVNYVIYLRA
jgi:hypothetical protein